jgi:hypothetical protein
MSIQEQRLTRAELNLPNERPEFVSECARIVSLVSGRLLLA